MIFLNSDKCFITNIPIHKYLKYIRNHKSLVDDCCRKDM